MSYRCFQLVAPAFLVLTSLPSLADVMLKNGADINMNGSVGSTIIFSDGTVRDTAQVQGPKGDKGDTVDPGPAGADDADGSDANVPTGHEGTNNTVTGS